MIRVVGRGWTTHGHPGVELRANLKSISHMCHLFEVAFVWELTKETIHLPLSCLQGGVEEAGAYGAVEMSPPVLTNHTGVTPTQGPAPWS